MKHIKLPYNLYTCSVYPMIHDQQKLQHASELIVNILSIFYTVHAQCPKKYFSRRKKSNRF